MWLRALSQEQQCALLGLAHDVIVSDGLLDPNEEQMMDDLRAEMGLGSDVEVDYLALDGIDEVFSTRRSRSIAMLNRGRVLSARVGTQLRAGRRNLRVDGQLGTALPGHGA